MNNKKIQNKPVIVTVINDSKKEYEDFFTKLSDSAKRDQSYLRQVLKGQRNFSIGVLQDIGSAFGMRYIMLPVPESPQLKRLIAAYAKELEYYWRVPLEDGCDAIFDFLTNAAHDKANFMRVCKALYMFNAVLSRAASINGSSETILEMLSTDTDKLMDLIWRLTHLTSETERENL